MINGYIFDLDGVITDTAEFHYLAWKRLADEAGLPFDRKDNESLRGVSRRRSLEILLKGRTFPEDTLQEMLTSKNGYYLDLVERITPADLLPGVLELFSEARAAGIRLAIGSASKNARLVCERLNIIHMMDAIGDGDSVVNSKPAPDLFVWVAGRLDLSPTQCVVFEDAEAGIEAALAGGFKAVGIGPLSQVGKAHYIRENLKGATFSEINQALS